MSMEKNHKKKHLKLAEHVHSLRDQRIAKSIDDTHLKKQKISSENQNTSHQRKANKSTSSFNLEDLRKEVKTREHRLIERDKELEKIYKFDSSSSSEKNTQYIKAVVETTQTEKSSHDGVSTKIWVCCCKKLCVVI